MSTIEDIKRSISELTYEESIELVREIRSNRRDRSTKKKKRKSKKKKRKSRKKKIDELSAEDAKSILKMLGVDNHE